MNFPLRAEYERNLGLKVFSLFLHLSHSVLAKNIAGNRFFNFLNFFATVFGIFLRILFPWSSMNRIWDWKLFNSFSTYLNPVWLKIMPEISFLIFLNFLLLFSEFSSKFSSPGLIRTEFGSRSFFSLSPPISFHFG